MKSTLLECQRYLYVVLVLLFPIISYSQTPSEIKIGTQIWTSKNLDVTTFRNGDSIPEARSQDEWVKAGENRQSAWCYYDNDPKNGKKYGKLYNWYAVNDPRGLAPNGWHIPSDEEWTILTDFLGGANLAGEKLKSKQGWKKDGKKSGYGNNSSGFNGLLGGYCFGIGDFKDLANYGYWWSSSEDTTMNWGGIIYLHRDYYSKVYRGVTNKEFGLSVRCIKD